MEWLDIDFNKGTIAINKTCHDRRDENGKLCRIIDTPKTTSSKRTIPIPKQLLPLLKEHKKKSNSQYIVSSNGHGITVRSYQRSFELLQKRNRKERISLSAPYVRNPCARMRNGRQNAFGDFGTSERNCNP